MPRGLRDFHPSPGRVRVSIYPENVRALRLCRSVGFEGSATENGEVVLFRQLIEPGHHS